MLRCLPGGYVRQSRLLVVLLYFVLRVIAERHLRLVVSRPHSSSPCSTTVRAIAVQRKSDHTAQLDTAYIRSANPKTHALDMRDSSHIFVFYITPLETRNRHSFILSLLVCALCLDTSTAISLQYSILTRPINLAPTILYLTNCAAAAAAAESILL